MDKNLHAESLAYAIKALKPYKPYIRAIYLYGSCARHEQKSSSDVDLFLYVTPDASPKLMREIRANISPDNISLPEVDVHFSMDNEFSGCRVFNNNLKKEAKLLWPKN